MYGVCVCVYLLFVAAVIGLFQWSLFEIKADLVDGRFEKVVLQTVNHSEAMHISTLLFNKNLIATVNL